MYCKVKKKKFYIAKDTNECVINEKFCTYVMRNNIYQSKYNLHSIYTYIDVYI